MSKKKLVENGAIGAGSIAAAPSRLGGETPVKRKHQSLKTYLSRQFSKKQAASRNLFKISEMFDMGDIVSRLKDMEGREARAEDSVTYGIEDDDGNMMKITVKSDQAQDFEQRLAQELADIKGSKANGEPGGKVSMAELLFNLKNEFEILDVEFPQIPSDVVYNADKATTDVPDTNQMSLDSEDDMGGDLGDGEDAFGDEGGMDDGMGGLSALDGGKGGKGGLDGDLGGLDGEEGEGDELDGDEDMLDDESVEDFPDEVSDTGTTPESLLKSVLDMLKADADAKRAQAEAEAEKARAQQAEWSAKAASHEVVRQEEIVRMEAEAERQKEKEKEARRVADLAKYRVQKAGGIGESAKPTFGSFLREVLKEYDEFDTPQTLQRQRQLLRQKFAPQPGDTPDERKYKQQSLLFAIREIDARIRRARLAQTVNRKEQQQARDPNQPQNPNQPNQQNNPQNPNQPVGPGQNNGMM